MNSSNCIEQKGVIEEINKGLAKVTIQTFSSCAGCESKPACGINESTSKQIDVKIQPGLFNIGEQVIILMERSMGIKAVVLAYLFPFILLLTALGIFTNLHFSELKAGLLSIGILLPYYIILYFSRKKIDKTFSFTLKKMN